MRKVIGVGQRDTRGRRTRDYTVKSGIIELARDEKSAPHLVEAGHERPERRDKGVGIIDLHGVNAAGITVDEIVSRKRELPEARFPPGIAIRVGNKNPTLIKELVFGAPKKSSNAANGIRRIDREGVDDVSAR